MGGYFSAYKHWPDLHLFDQNFRELREKVLNPTLHGRTKYNILLVGKKGVGKSSLKNGLATVASNDFDRIKAPANVRSDNTSITLEMKRYPAGECIVIHDMPGYDPQEVLNGKITLATIINILDGRVPDKDNFEGETRVEAKPEWKIDAVMLVMDPIVEQLPNNPMVQFYKDLIKTCERRGISITIVMTKVNNLCRHTRRKLKNVHESYAVYQAVNHIHEMTGMNTKYIMPVKNYTNEHVRVTEMDLLLLHALDVTMNLTVDAAEGRPDVDYGVIRNEAGAAGAN